ncbi:hypothetical protein KFL_009320020 [Klebsormidium nitens]|uniref:Uncharacterized protein n=1 Tax=Klebsormidium nitens TaxID=105231 RepID=A0A1Y1IMM3_KLENI|nr:hypothetical protein KFL_009320020 [Klebsormidium nitens]|eukprot:GAQ92145.1 hypothetical protein KFL_009320020 [Klebsormidium nitens]
MAPPTVAQPAEIQIAYLLWKCKEDAMPLRVLATCVERFPGRRRDTSGLLELALGVLDAFRRQMERAAQKLAPLLISAEKSITVEQPEPQIKSRPGGSIAYGVTGQQRPAKKTRSPVGCTSSKLEVIEVSDDSESAETAGKSKRRDFGAHPGALEARSAHARESCGDNFSTEGQGADTKGKEYNRYCRRICGAYLEAGLDPVELGGLEELGVLERLEENRFTWRVGLMSSTGLAVWARCKGPRQSGEPAIADPVVAEQAGQTHKSQRKGLWRCCSTH